MDICTATTAACAGESRNLTFSMNGVTVTLSHVHESELSALTPAELETFLWLSLRRLKQIEPALSLAQLLGRVSHGLEATNVKQYDLIGPGSAVTKTNIGTAYSNILPGLNGQRVLVDFTGCTEFRIILNANLVGTGAFRARVVRDSDDAVLFENTNLGAAGERELDTNWQPLPVAASGLALIRLQASSATASDDPVFRRCVLVVR